MPLRRSTSAIAVLGPAAAPTASPAALTVSPAAADAHGRGHDTEFRRLATFPAYGNSSIDDAAAAEISTVPADGRTDVYTDSPGKRLGFVDITDPGNPRPAARSPWAAPTSVAHLGHLLLAAVNTPPSGKLVVVTTAAAPCSGRSTWAASRTRWRSRRAAATSPW
jgi:hypothetical protein